MNDKILKATHDAPLKIGDYTIISAVLEDGTRVLTRASLIRAIGRTGKAKGGREYDDEFKTPVFLSAKNLKPFISDTLNKNSTPIIFNLKGREAIGYRAELLPEICGIFMDAYEAGVLAKNQEHIAKKCKILLRGFATVGIIALIDEATGYQADRDREALQAILDKFFRDHLAKWAKTFPDEFYEHLFKLKGWQYQPLSVKRPSVVGHWTNDIVYARLAPGVLTKLREKTPKDHKGRRRHKFFQWLTDDYGHPALKQHLSNVIFLMKAYTKWDQFYRALQRAAPKYGDRFLPHVHNNVDDE